MIVVIVMNTPVWKSDAQAGKTMVQIIAIGINVKDMVVLTSETKTDIIVTNTIIKINEPR